MTVFLIDLSADHLWFTKPFNWSVRIKMFFFVKEVKKYE
jgi:hypothetical protein